MFNSTAFNTAMYEIVSRLLPRVALKDKPGVIGLVLKTSNLDKNRIKVHWGVSDGSPVQTWHNIDDLIVLTKEEVQNESTNGHIPG